MSSTPHLRLALHAAAAASLAAAVVCGVAAPAQAAAARAPAAAPASGPGSLTGVWIISGYKSSQRYPERERVFRTLEGDLPPMQPWAAELLEKRVAEAEQGKLFANTLSQCLPGGVPEVMFGAGYPIQILETAGQVTILFEEQNHFRLVYLNEAHPEGLYPTFMGHSVARWQGDTLVVDTVGLTDRTTIDQVGMPHSEDLHVVERFRRADKDTLEILVTIEDPKTFTRPWTMKATYKLAPAGTKVTEYICENNRNAASEQGYTTFQFSPAAR